MKRLARSWLLVLACGALWGCSKANAPERGSQTHFVECTERSDCAELGAEFACVDGRCRVEQSTADAGRAAAAGRAGSTSAGRGGEGSAGTDAMQAGRSGADASSAGAGGSAAAGPLCDGSDAVWLWAGTAGGGPLEPTFPITNPLGHSYLMLDGRCRYYVFREIMAGARTGTLTEAEAQQIAGELGYANLSQWEAHVDAPCPDAAVQVIARPDARAGCSCGCDEDSPAGLADAIRASTDWSATLTERGEELDGPIAAIAASNPTAAAPPGPPLDWPLATQIADIAGFVQDANAPGMPVRFLGADAALLRTLRAAARERPQTFNRAFVSDGSGAYDVYMHDELPEAVADSLEAFSNE